MDNARLYCTNDTSGHPKVKFILIKPSLQPPERIRMKSGEQVIEQERLVEELSFSSLVKCEFRSPDFIEYPVACILRKVWKAAVIRGIQTPVGSLNS